MTNRAILSLYDKTELTTLGRRLQELGWELIASGGTARALRDAGLPVTDVADVTGAPEMLGGRVKTLHPAIHGGILARDSEQDRDELASQNIAPIDLVVCNLYPFQETLSRPGVTPQEAVEQIDIGGVTLLRAAAKNYERVAVLCDPADYEQVLQELAQSGEVSTGTRRALAAKAFAHTRDYDTAISTYFDALRLPDQSGETMPDHLQLDLQRVQSLRYGENPHQAAALYSQNPGASPLGGELLQGKPLSYNNLLDLDAACRTVAGFEQPTVVIVKHLSPCGIASHPRTLAQAFPHALASDPVSAFGGVIAVNRPVEEQFTEALQEAGLFVEAVLAPDFSPAARDWFAANKKNCRLLVLDPHQTPLDDYGVRSVLGGFLVQEPDNGDPAGTEWHVVSEREPDVGEWEALKFAWQAVPFVQSNAIIFAATLEGEGSATVGIGGGLPSRVDAVRLAAAKAGEQARGAVMASDAFFPFPDGIEVAAEAGITAVIQPGGSIRDEQVIAAADGLGLAMVFTGARHFRH
jgi:phosphoribosylaminoimidazolecarboxamide formyltransferase/IMP cyclohydrolase